jgi:hypothetical protein
MEAHGSILLCTPIATDTGAFELTSWPDVHRYARLVNKLNYRQLSKSDDIFDAFAKLLSAFSQSFPGSFICGLPEAFFDAVLLWQPWDPIKRRVASRLSRQWMYPTWSWYGWQGGTQTENWRSSYNYMRKNADEFRGPEIWHPLSWQTFSTVQWYYSALVDSERHRITNSYQHLQALEGFDTIHTAPLPGGWTQGVCSTTGRPIYKHMSDEQQTFWHMVPIRDQNSDPKPPSNAPFLHCHTQLAFMHFGQVYQTNASPRFAVDLVDNAGNWAGVLRLNQESHNLDTNLNAAFPGGVPLIELSRSSVSDGPLEEELFDEWRCPHWKAVTAGGHRYEFYNVMWVVVKDFVYHRVAVGRVVKEKWDMIEKEPIDVILN